MVPLLAAAGSLVLMPGMAGAAGIKSGLVYRFKDVYTYFNYNTINTTTGQPAKASIYMSNADQYDEPANWFGARATMWYIHNAQDQVCNRSPTIFNPTRSYWVEAVISPGCGAGYTYFSWGESYAWNGSNAYVAFTSYQSGNETS